MINLRAVVPNPNGDLLPGMFVRARLEEGARPDSVLISQRCVLTIRLNNAMWLPTAWSVRIG